MQTRHIAATASIVTLSWFAFIAIGFGLWISQGKAEDAGKRRQPAGTYTAWQYQADKQRYWCRYNYTNGSGHGQNYAVSLMENGDKIFSRQEVLIQTVTAADGSRTSKFTNVVTLTGGTGKFKGIRGTLRSSGQTDFKMGTSGVETEGEYWIEK